MADFAAVRDALEAANVALAQSAEAGQSGARKSCRLDGNRRRNCCALMDALDDNDDAECIRLMRISGRMARWRIAISGGSGPLSGLIPVPGSRAGGVREASGVLSPGGLRPGAFGRAEEQNARRASGADLFRPECCSWLSAIPDEAAMEPGFLRSKCRKRPCLQLSPGRGSGRLRGPMA